MLSIVARQPERDRRVGKGNTQVYLFSRDYPKINEPTAQTPSSGLYRDLTK